MHKNHKEIGLRTPEHQDQKKRGDANPNREKNTDDLASASAQVDLPVRPRLPHSLLAIAPTRTTTINSNQAVTKY
jgi:hypothetical protein